MRVEAGHLAGGCPCGVGDGIYTRIRHLEVQRERERESSVQENLNRLPRVPRPRTIQLIPIELSVESDHQSCPLMYDVMFTFCSENTLHPLNK